MRIKQLELNGFKSFMQRTVIELPKGVTAVVGPNGCGKSNIVDAIRWVLGEQSAKHLRGAAMEDVICNGNADNGPLGMAEVSLLMERDEADLLRAAAEAGDEAAGGEDALPPGLGQASEVLVTRRYFRSGESEYFINRALCRLKDITELFLGTGVGTKAYAIIEQGRIEQLVNAKPEEMRLFIEEAAGVTRFRSRKLAAERKMERTRENLLRVQDVLHELDRQRASLERQARRAEEYHRLKDELRGLDLRVMAARRRTLVDELIQLGDRLRAVQEEEATLQAEIDRLRSATSEARRRRQEHEARLAVVEEESTQQRLQASAAEARVAGLAARSVELKGRAVQAIAEAATLHERSTELEARAATVGETLVRLTAEVAAASAAHAEAERRLHELSANGQQLEVGVEEAKDALHDALAEEVRTRNLADALRARRDELAGRRSRLSEEQRILGERLSANASGREAVRERLASLEADRVRIAAEHAELGATLERLALEEAGAGAALDAVRAELTQLRSRAESLRELQARYEGCARGAASLLAREDTEGALLASVLQVPAALERAVAAALGGRLGHVVVADTPAATAAVHWLRETGSGSATVVPRDPERRATVIVPAGRRLLDEIQVDPQHWSLAEAVLGHVLLADDLEEALRLWRDASYAVTVVTPAGEALDPLGAVTGGSEPPLEETLLARARELRELDAAMTGARERVEQAGAVLDGVRSQIADARTRRANADARLQSTRLEIVAAEKDRERLEEERARIAAELEVGAMEASGIAGADGEVTQELAALDGRSVRAEQAVVERRTQLGERQAAFAAWREAQTAAEEGRTAAAITAAGAGERRRAVEAELAHCRATLAEVQERHAVALRDADGATLGAADADTERATVEEGRREAEARIAVLVEERDRLRAAIAVADQEVSAEDLAEQDARIRLDEAREQRGATDIAVAEHRLALEHLSGQLAERYELGLDALDDVPPQDPEAAAAEAMQAEQIRARLLRIGDVNPGAVSELAEVKERIEFLTAQRADLENSLDDLKRTIGKLTRTSEERFEETFAAANEKLAVVFPKLFPGGQARLQLVTPEEGGEPGIEIVVQPAGKQLRSLSLLSGGEKALTATALVLSLFLIRPTPFCLLDEVDAPLDEANIGRFNQLIREMSETSQFVLITHNRRTMEVADTLYGITMEQAGVSKVVSVRLREAA